MARLHRIRVSDVKELPLYNYNLQTLPYRVDYLMNRQYEREVIFSL